MPDNSPHVEELLRMKRRLFEMSSEDPARGFKEERALIGAAVLIEVAINEAGRFHQDAPDA